MFVMAAYRVHRSTHRVAAVQQRGRTLDNLELVQLSGVDHLSVVPRLRRESAGANAVFHDQHSIAVESADDGKRTSRTGAAFRNPGADQVVQHFAKGSGRRFGQFRGVEGFYVLERLEGRLMFIGGCDGNFVFFPCQGQQKVQ